MKPEPRKLPTYPDEIQHPRWYCFHCEQHRLAQEAIHVHCLNFHNISRPENGEDYGDASFTLRKAQLRAVWEVNAQTKFHRQLESLLGADDFVIDVGDGSELPPIA